MKKIAVYYKKLFINEYKLFRSEVSVTEYIIWWIMRGLLLTVIIKWSIENGNSPTDELAHHPLQIVQIWANLLGTFIVPVFRIVFPKQLFLGRLSYRTQKWGSFLCFFNCFFGHCLGLNLTTYLFDALEHFLSGFVLVFLCYQIIMSMRHDKREVSPLIGSVCGFGMAAFCHIGWEFFEFIVDYTVPNSGNQDYSYAYGDDYLPYRLFGKTANPGQTPLFDTMSDFAMALIASVIGAAFLWLSIYRRQKKEKAAALQPDDDTASSVSAAKSRAAAVK